MAALIQFVDSISASPTVRLDVNDALSWFCTSFKAPPPRLRRSVSQNAMRDGQHVSSSSYEARELTLELTLIEEADEDYAAQEMQKLWRELDRETNFLLYHPDGLDKPVFFVLQRSDVEDLEELWTSPIARNITIVLPAEPFALGEMEALGPFTVTNDPAAASNGMVVPLSGIIGDVAAPLSILDATSARAEGLVGSSTTAPVFMQAEAMTLGNMTLPGNDVLMSGAGSNYARSSSVSGEASVMLTVPSGVGYRIFGVARASGSATMSAVDATPLPYGPTVSISSGRRIYDFGTIGRLGALGMPSETGGTSSNAQRFLSIFYTTAGTVDLDFVALLPSDGTLGAWLASGLDVPGDDLLLAGEASGGVFQVASGGTLAAPGNVKYVRTYSGSLPTVTPGATTYLTWILLNGGGATAHSKTATSSLTVAYHPRYLHIRSSMS